MKKLWALPILSLSLTSASILVSTTARASTFFTSSPSGDQEVLTNPDGSFTSIDTGSPAMGSATLDLNEAENALSYSIDFTGLDFGPLSTLDPNTSLDGAADNVVTQVHIHNAPAGENGAIVFSVASLTGSGFDDLDDVSIGENTISGVWEASDPRALTPELVSELRSGNLYFNIHTVGFPGGEIRGQIGAAPGDDATQVPEPTVLIGLGLVSGYFFLKQQRQKES